MNKAEEMYNKLLAAEQVIDDIKSEMKDLIKGGFANEAKVPDLLGHKDTRGLRNRYHKPELWKVDELKMVLELVMDANNSAYNIKKKNQKRTTD